MTPPAPSLTTVVQRCVANEDPKAWLDLVRILQPVFARIACRVAREWGVRPAIADIDDIVQETYVKFSANGVELLRRIPTESDQSAIAYIRTVAANCAYDYMKAKYAAKRGLNRTSTDSENIEALSVSLDNRGMERDVLLAQVDAVLDADRVERNVFWLYYRQGYTAKEISTLPGCSLGPKGVESLIFRLTAAARKALNKRGVNP
jgi:RNA polymerase sigma-70 factor, ECF subfamily